MRLFPRPLKPRSPLPPASLRRTRALAVLALLATAGGSACVDWEGARAEFCGDESLCRGDARHVSSRSLGEGSRAELSAMATVGSAGDAVLGGSFAQRAVFGLFTAETAGAADALVMRVDDQGNPRWLRRFGGTAEDRVSAVTALATGDVIVLGQSASAELALTPTAALRDAGTGIGFVARLSSTGELLWAINLSNSTEGRQPRGASLDAEGNVLTTGIARAGGSGSEQLMVARIAPDGAARVAVVASCTDGGIGGSQVVASGASLYVVGDYVGSGCTLSTGKQLASSSGKRGLFVLGLDAELSPVWVATQADANLPRAGASALALSPSGKLLVASESQGVVVPAIGSGTPPAGTTLGFVAEVDRSSGAFVWATAVRGSAGLELRHLSVAPDGTAWVGGEFSGTASAGERVRSSQGGTDVLLFGVSPGGAVADLLTFGHAGDQASSVSSYGADGLLMAGTFQQEVTFGGELLSAPQPQLFLARLKL